MRGYPIKNRKMIFFNHPTDDVITSMKPMSSKETNNRLVQQCFDDGNQSGALQSRRYRPFMKTTFHISFFKKNSTCTILFRFSRSDDFSN